MNISNLCKLFFIQVTLLLPVILLAYVTQEIQVPVNNSIIFYKGNDRSIPCSMCYDKYFSDAQYLSPQCYDQRDDKNYINSTNRRYHALCVPFHDESLFQKEVQCQYPLPITNGSSTLYELYSVPDDVPVRITQPIIGTILTIHCDTGYVPLSPTVECIIEDHRPAWYPQPHCYRTGCFAIPNPEHGQSTCNTVQLNGTECYISCTKGYQSNFDSTTCLDGNYTLKLKCIKLKVHVEEESFPVKVALGVGVPGGLFLLVVVIYFIRKKLRRKIQKRREAKNKSPANGVAYHPINGVQIVSSSNSPQNTNFVPNGRVPLDSGTNEVQPGSSLNLNSIPKTDPVPNGRVPLDSGTNGVEPGSSLNLNSISKTDPVPNGRVSLDSKTNGVQPGSSLNLKSLPKTDPEANDVTVTDVEQPVPGSSNQYQSQIVAKSKPLEAVENSDLTEDVLVEVHVQPRNPVEHEDFGTLPSNGQDIVDDARRLNFANAGQPQQGGENTGVLTSQTLVKQVVNSHTDPENERGLCELNGQQKYNSIPSNPKLEDFGTERHSSDPPFHKPQTAIPELNRQDTDQAYGSVSLLPSNAIDLVKLVPPPPNECEDDDESDNDTGRGTYGRSMLADDI